MLFKLCFLLIIIEIHMKLTWGAASTELETDARLFVGRVNQHMFGLYETIHRLTFNRKKYEYYANLETIAKTIDEIAAITLEAQKFNLNDIKNPELKLELENIQKSAYLYILGSSAYDDLTIIVEEMILPAIKRGVCEYKNSNNCDLSYIPDIKNMIASNQYGSDELLYYWSEWRSGVETISRPLLPRFIEYFKSAAIKTNVSPVEFLYNYFGGDKSIINDMKQVMDELMPFYKEFHAYVRHELNIKFGNDIVSKTGPIPDHIFQAILLQAWKKHSILPQAYPDKKLPNLKAGLDKGIHNIQTMINVTENYYASIGFGRLPRNIRLNFKKITDNELGNECKAEIYDQTPNVRMEYCPRINIKKFFQMHGYLGRVHYAFEKRDLPFHFFNSYKFEIAVGEAIILSASSPEHLENIGVVPQFTYTPKLELNRLYRMGVHTLFNIPIYYVHVKLIEDLLSGITNLDNINVHYWNLMEEYAGVEPPINRSIDALDMSYKFFDDLKSNHLVTKFVSEILGYQFYESLCTLNGIYNVNSTKTQLHDCNLEGHREVGEILKNMMRIGSKKPWREVLSAVTGNINGLSSKGLLNYYGPLRIWIKEQIQNKNINVGWSSSNKG